MAEPFTGFPPESFEFFGELARHNDRDWFTAHKPTYEIACRAPMQALVAALESRYGGPTRISRINRDLRFSKNKAPYKTHISAGVAGRYISLGSEGIWAGAGLYRPEPDALARWRAAVDRDATGRRIEAIVDMLRGKRYGAGTHESLASAPRGYATDHPRIELLKMKDIYVGRDFAPARWLSTAKALERIEKVMDDTAPLVEWLRREVGGSPLSPRERKERGKRRSAGRSAS